MDTKNEINWKSFLKDAQNALRDIIKSTDVTIENKIQDVPKETVTSAIKRIVEKYYEEHGKALKKKPALIRGDGFYLSSEDVRSLIITEELTVWNLTLKSGETLRIPRATAINILAKLDAL